MSNYNSYRRSGEQLQFISKMRGIHIIVFILLSVYGNAQKLIKDPVCYGNSKIILSIPESMIQKSRVFDYEEGFFKDYPLGGETYITLRCGGLNCREIEPDSLIYKCKLANIASSLSYVKGDKYFRVDEYPPLGISFEINYATKDNIEVANSILDNAVIVRHIDKNARNDEIYESQGIYESHNHQSAYFDVCGL